MFFMSYVYVVTTPMFLVMKRKGDEVKPRNSNLKTRKKMSSCSQSLLMNSKNIYYIGFM